MSARAARPAGRRAWFGPALPLLASLGCSGASPAPAGVGPVASSPRVDPPPALGLAQARARPEAGVVVLGQPAAPAVRAFVLGFLRASLPDGAVPEGWVLPRAAFVSGGRSRRLAAAWGAFLQARGLGPRLEAALARPAEFMVVSEPSDPGTIALSVSGPVPLPEVHWSDGEVRLRFLLIGTPEGYRIREVQAAP